MGKVFFISVGLLVLSVTGPPGTIFPQAKRNLELTDVDLFALKDWDSSQVSVLGVKLGMRRNEAVLAARLRGMKIINISPPDAGKDCIQQRCGIYGLDGHTGVHIVFGDDGRLQEMQMDLFAADAGGGLWITKQLKGASRELAMHYSDSLRSRLLGREDEYCVVYPMGPKPLVQSYSYTYSYNRRGLAFYVDTVKDDSPVRSTPRVVVVSLSFETPKK